MNKHERLKNVGKIFTVFGAIFIFLSGWVGNFLSNIWLTVVGGIAETTAYEFKRYSYTFSILSIATVVFAVGLASLIIAWYNKQEN